MSFIFFFYIYIYIFCFLNLTSAPGVKERLSSLPLLHGNVQLFPCGQPPMNSDPFPTRLLESLFGSRAGRGGTARAGWPSPGHTWPVRLSHTRLQPPPRPALRLAWQLLTAHTWNEERSSIHLLWIKQDAFVFYVKSILSSGMLNITCRVCHKSICRSMLNVASRIQLL